MKQSIYLILILCFLVLGRHAAMSQDAVDAAAKKPATGAANDAGASETEDAGASEDAGDDAGTTAEIEAAIQSYVSAFNAKDVGKLVSHWSPNGVYTSRTSGEQVVGHEAMTATFTEIFAGDDVPKLAVATDSIQFISPSVALERGSATVTRAEGETETNYSVVYVKQDDLWLIDRVTEDEITVGPSHYDHLMELEWLVGDWVDDTDGITIDIECRWAKNQNYISRKYSVSTQQGVESSGLQIIGWDASQKQIRSWLFDSEGGFVSGTWAKRDDRWIVQSVATLADGATGSFTSVFHPTDDGNYTWQKMSQVLDGKLLPNVDEVVVLKK